MSTMYRNLLLTVAVLASLALPSGAPAQAGPKAPAESDASRGARMKWWREAKFGMFIHWGVYAVPAGVYEGRPIGGIGEWIMHQARIPVARYRQFASQFTAAKYDPDAWVRMAKGAGMKYIVITSKHHDGFALFDSKASDWNVVKATPHGKDLLRPLAEACRRHGIKLGFYYSEAQDWNNPGGAAAGGHWDPAQDGSMDDYVRDVAVPQVREILTAYGKDVPAILWWDTPTDMTPERAAPLFQTAKQLKPNIITNNRLGGGFEGDTETPEQYIPPTGYRNRDWEVCMTLNDTWGYKSTDHNWKSTETLVRNLVDIVSKGGNYLLNVGPTSEGLIPPESVSRLAEVGEWMKVNGSAVYGTTASPFRSLPWGRCTTRRERGRTTLYLHVFDWPTDGRLTVPGLLSKVADARLLAAPGTKLTHSAGENGVTIDVPATAPGRYSSTVALRLAGELRVAEPAISPGADGAYDLAATAATLHGERVQLEGEGAMNVGFWVIPSDWIEWIITVKAPGPHTVVAEVASPGPSTVVLSAQGAALHANIPSTGDYRSYTTVELGTLDVSGTGRVSVQVRPPADAWTPINVRRLRLVPRK